MAYLSVEEIRHHYPPSLQCEDVHNITGINTATIREMLQKGLLPFGYAIKSEGKDTKWRYIIPTERFLFWYQGKDMMKYSERTRTVSVEFNEKGGEKKCF